MGTLKRMFIGSTSKFCLEYAECCVVVVKKPCGPSLPDADVHEERILGVAAVDYDVLVVTKLPSTDVENDEVAATLMMLKAFTLAN